MRRRKSNCCPWENREQLKEALIKDINTVLNAIITPDGELNTEALRFKADNAKTYIEKGKEYLQSREELYLAEFMLSQATKMAPNNEDAQYYYGLSLASQGKSKEAQPVFQNVIEINNKNAVAYQELANLYADDRRYEEALILYEKAVQLRPDLKNIHLNLGEIYYIQGKNDLAVIELQKATESIEPSGDKESLTSAYDLLGRAYRSQENIQEAKQAFQKALNVDPQNPEARASLGKIYTDESYEAAVQQKYEESYKIAETAKNYTKNETVYAILTFTLNKLEQWENVISVFEEAKKEDTINATIYNNAGFAYTKLGKTEKALDAFDNALQLYPKQSMLYFNKASLLSRNGKFWETVKVYDRLLKIDDKNAKAYYYKGVALFNMDNYEEAIKSFESAVSIDPNNAGAFADMASALNAMGKNEKAAEAYSRALELTPKNYTLLNNLAYTLGEIRNYDEAIKMADAAIEQNPKAANPYNHKGFSLYKSGKQKEGLEFIHKAITLNPNYGGAYYNLSRIFIEEKNYTEGLLNLRKAIELNRKAYARNAEQSEAFDAVRDHPEYIELVKK